VRTRYAPDTDRQRETAYSGMVRGGEKYGGASAEDE
jgi:hypothetical protein